MTDLATITERKRQADCRALALNKVEKRTAGRQAIVARNELIRRELAKGTPAIDLARRYEMGITTVEKLGRCER